MQLGKEVNETKDIVNKLHDAFLRQPLQEFKLGYRVTSDDQAAVFVRSIDNTIAHVINGRVRFRTPTDFTMLLMDKQLFYLLSKLSKKNCIFGINQSFVEEHLKLWGARHNGGLQR